MATFLLAPFLALFSARLYREALGSGVGRGFGYLVYLTFLFSVLAFLLSQLLLLPIASSFMDWLIQVTPEMTLTRAGLDAKVNQPYRVAHPAFGPIYLIDTTKTAAELMADESGVPILIGKEHVVVRNLDRNESRVFDLKEATRQARNTSGPIQITKHLMRDLTRQIEALIIPISLLFLAPLFFIWKLIAALFYSLVALLLNLIRKEKFRYRSLFTLSSYAITPVTFIQALDLFIPGFSIPLNFLLALVVTTAYLIYGMFAVSRNTG